jgi:hypothetical protein
MDALEVESYLVTDDEASFPAVDAALDPFETWRRDTAAVVALSGIVEEEIGGRSPSITPEYRMIECACATLGAPSSPLTIRSSQLFTVKAFSVI